MLKLKKIKLKALSSFIIIFSFFFFLSCSSKKNYNVLNYNSSKKIIEKKFNNETNKENNNLNENYDAVMEYMNEQKVDYKKIDPAEKLNRKLFLIHNAFDKVLLHPISVVYNTIPKGITNLFGNFLSNFFSPLKILCHFLAGDFKNAGTTTWRFIWNSTFGIFGIFDPAKKLGVQKTEANFEKVLKKIGVNEGPYLILPILGPTNLRSAVGRLFDTFCDPFLISTQTLKVFENKKSLLKKSYNVLKVSSSLVSRAELDETLTKIQKNSDSEYEDIRAIFCQQN